MIGMSSVVWKHTEETLILIGIGEFVTGSETWPSPRKRARVPGEGVRGWKTLIQGVGQSLWGIRSWSQRKIGKKYTRRS